MVTTSAHKVAIVLVNWNGLEFTAACLDSLRKVSYPDFEVIVVDNGSEHEEGKRLKIQFPEIHLIETGENLGFAGGNNVGIRKAMDGDFSHVLLLNNDTIVETDFLNELVKVVLSQPKAGIVQPMILLLHQAKLIWSAGGKWIPDFSRSVTLGDREPAADYRVKTSQIDWATGCAMLVSRDAIAKGGLLNEQFFVYFEDVEWSLRIRDAGFEIHLAESSKIYHEAGASSKKQHDEGILSPRVFYFHVRNQLFLVRLLRKKGLSISLSCLSFGYHLGRFSLWMGYFLLRGRFQKLKSVAKGVRDGLFQPLSQQSWR